VETDYINEAQIMVQAPDAATAQEAMEAAVAAMTTALAALEIAGATVAISCEKEMGTYVLSLP
jgi:hypothetical protein